MLRSRSLLLIVACLATPLSAQSRFQLEAGAEYLAPTKDDRRIETVQVDLRLRRRFAGPLGLSIGGGLTVGEAWGHIIQLDSTLTTRRYTNAATSIGPHATARATPLRLGHARVGAEVGVGLLYYSRRFPAGGDRYNGMFRLGPVLTIPVGGSELTVAGHWMHVSNGTGLRPGNPSYEGRGLELTYSKELRSSSTARPRWALPAGLAGMVAGGVVGAIASHHCDGERCGPGPGITLAGAVSGGAFAAILGGLLGGVRKLD